MTLLYTNPLFLEHRTGAHHPERPERLQAVLRQLERTGLDQQCQRVPWSPASAELLAGVHKPEYLRQIEHFCQQGGGRIEEDTVCSPHSAGAARLAAGAACDAVSRVLAGEASTAGLVGSGDPTDPEAAIELEEPPSGPALHALTPASPGLLRGGRCGRGASRWQRRPR